MQSANGQFAHAFRVGRDETMACRRLASQIRAAPSQLYGRALPSVRARGVGGIAIAAGSMGAAVGATSPRQARCAPFEGSTAESACCMIALGALQLGLAARWALWPETLVNDFGRHAQTAPKLEAEIEAAVFSEHLDTASGRAYYCNVVTREVVWELPPGATMEKVPVQEHGQDQAQAHGQDAAQAQQQDATQEQQQDAAPPADRGLVAET